MLDYDSETSDSAKKEIMDRKEMVRRFMEGYANRGGGELVVVMSLAIASILGPEGITFWVHIAFRSGAH